MRRGHSEWVGILPDEWVSLPLRYVAACKPNSAAYNGSSPYVALENITPWTGEIYNLSDASVDSNVSNFTTNDVLFGKLRPYLGKVARPNYQGVCSTEILPITPFKAMDRDYLYWVLSNEAFIQVVNADAYGVKMPRTSWVQMRDTIIPIPPLEEQRGIVEELDSRCSAIDSVISTIEREVSTLESYRSSRIHEVVTRGLDPGAEMRDSGVEWIGEIPSGWKMGRLGYLASFESGATPSKDNLDYWNGDIPWISSMEVKSDILYDTSLHISEEGMNSCSTRLLPVGTLVMVVRSGILQHTLPVAITGAPMVVNQDVKALRFGGEMLPKYFFYFVRGNNDNLLKALLKDKSTVDNVSMRYLASLKVPIPSIDEQRAIIAYLDESTSRITAVIGLKRRQLDVLKRYRQSVIYEYVTGKRRVASKG